jgi:hypothetical protein
MRPCDTANAPPCDGSRSVPGGRRRTLPVNRPGYDIAVVYEGLADRSNTLRWLDTAYREHSGFIVHVAWDPRFASLRSEPTFLDLLHKMGLPEHTA